ncbi:cysteine-rich receptor-like protein kinase 25 [Aegilops tauschii subsp. strangulata]|nr:cysteine-rich receptor-like protein kinase 10 [Aegilops tauschii subsp. strangulata]
MITVLLLILGFEPFVAAVNPLTQICYYRDSHLNESTYKANLELLSTALFSSASSTRTNLAKGFVGTDQDRIYGVVVCRGDGVVDACPSCITTAFQDVWRVCRNHKEAHILYKDCIVHISAKDLIYDSTVVLNRLLVFTDTTKHNMDPNIPSEVRAKYTDVSIDGNIKVLLQETAKQAAYNSTMMYATGRMDVYSTIPLLYSLAQCNLGLSPNDCWDCLDNIRSAAKSFFYQQRGEWIAGVWCNFRYSTYQFYEGQPMQHITLSGAVDPTTNMPAPKPAPGPVDLHRQKDETPSHKHKSKQDNILYVETFLKTLKGLDKLCLLSLGKLSSQEDEELVWGIGRSPEFKLFDFSEVSNATNNFSDENKLGQGGFGPVYKGQLPEGLEIAIKRLASHSGQGFTEFKNEVQLIAKLQHTNLVRLLGCCSQGEEKILIYEYLPNKSLDSFIFDETKRALLNWNKRKAIIEGIAQGLLYLHKHSRLRVIHRDLKASNILLDSEMNPKISDFGLAKIFSSNDIEGNTKRVAGTYGYMAPEYASEGLFSIKSDVFSFGVLILETIHGKRNSSFHKNGDFFNLLGYAWKLWKEERWLEFVDESIVSESHVSETMRCINIALLCVQENAADRPTTTSVVTMLSSESIALPEPKHPAYFHVRVTDEEPPSANDVTMSALQGR